VFCRPSPIPTSNAADPARSAFSFNPSSSSMIRIAMIQTKYLMI
jgi:hypothetical protein